MSFNKYLLYLGITLVTVLTVYSCKKDDDDSTDYQSFSGTPGYELPVFGHIGDLISVNLTGWVKDEDGNVIHITNENKKKEGYYWYISNVTEAVDTTENYILAVPDTLYTLNLICTAYKENYYTASTTKGLTVISDDKENGSITGRRQMLDDFKYVDPRDNKEYMCTNINGTDWFKENLAYEAIGTPYRKSYVVANCFGMFYTWEEAQVACPEGWRLASQQDWADLATYAGAEKTGLNSTIFGVAGKLMGNIKFNQEDLWDYWREVKKTNDYGLDIIPMGYAVIGDDDDFKFDGVRKYAAHWTSDSKDADHAYYRYIYEGQNDILCATATKEGFATPVRCVR